MITEEECIIRLEEYVFDYIDGLISENKFMFRINESESKNLDDNSISECFEKNITRICIKNLDNVNEPIYVANQSDAIIKHEIPTKFLSNLFYDINEDKRLEYIQKYKIIYINIDAKAVKNNDNDSKFEQFHFSNSQTSIQNFHGTRKNGISYNASGKQKTFINNKLNLTFLIKAVWSYNKKYKYDKIHLYCIPNGFYFKNIKLIINPKSYPQNIDGRFEIRLKTQQLPDNYYSEILI